MPKTSFQFVTKYQKYIRPYAAYMRTLTHDRRVAGYLLVFLAVGFLLLSVIVYFFPRTSIEIELSRELQDEQHPLLDVFMIAVSWFGYNSVAIPSIAVVALVLFIASYRREAFFVAITSLASVINYGLKLLFHRQRPTADVLEVYRAVSTNSFPSGHVVHYVVFFGFLIVLMYRLRNVSPGVRIGVSLLCLVLIFSVPFSRVYLGAHWFTDVLAGFFLGLLLLSALMYFYFRPARRGT